MRPARRLFAGIALGDAQRVRAAMAAQRLLQAGFAARYEPEEKLHVTLAFLGNVDAARADDAALALRRAAQTCAPFEIVFDRFGAFPHERRPRVVFIGAREQGKSFRDLARALREDYARLGYAFGDDAVAHVTIARVKDPIRPLPPVEFPPIAVSVRAVTLFESVFDKAKNTSRYDVFSFVPLTSSQP